MNKTNVMKDLLVGLKNGYSNKNKFAYCKLNSFSLNLVWELYKEELIYDFIVEENKSRIQITLKYFKNKPLLSTLDLISKPSLSNFSGYDELDKFYKKFDYFFVSTTLGVISSRSIKKKKKIGGQKLFGFKLNT